MGIRARRALGGGIAVLFLMTVSVVLPASAAAALEPVYLVNTIQTSLWSPPSPDPSGLVYVPHTNRLIVVDGEVDEMPNHFVGFNVFETTLDGQLTGTFTTVDYSTEPTGITFDADRFDFFFVDDNKAAVHQVDPGADGAFGTKDDTVGWFSTKDFGSADPEGVTYAAGSLYVSDGVGSEIYVVSPGGNGLFDGVPPKGDDEVTHFDVGAYGVSDPEGVAYSVGSNSLFVLGTNNELIEVTRAGSLLRSFDLSRIPAKAPSDVAVAPASAVSGVTHLYLSDRGVDNGADPLENDGRIFEVTLDGTEPPTTTTTLPPTTTTSSSTTTTLPPAQVELLVNGGFETDSNGDRRPDGWTSSKKFLRSAETVHGGLYAAKFYAIDNKSVTIGQAVPVTAGQTYTFSGWMNIPQSLDAFTFRVQLKYRDAQNAVIQTYPVLTQTSPTGGWVSALLATTAPAQAVTAYVQMDVSSLGLAIYVDDFSLNGAAPPPPPTTTTLPPTTTTTTLPPPTTTTSTTTTTTTTTTTLPPTTTTSSTTTSTSTTLPPSLIEMLVNGGFEIDDNADGRPDGWTTSSKFTTSATLVRSGLYSGRFFAADNTSVTIKQYFVATPGARYDFTGWVNIPPTADAFSYRIQIKFWDAASTVIQINPIKTYLASTNGWDLAAGSAIAPAAASMGYVQIDASNMALEVFADDFSVTKQ